VESQIPFENRSHNNKYYYVEGHDEVPACIGFKQPISQEAIEQIFGEPTSEPW